MTEHIEEMYRQIEKKIEMHANKLRFVDNGVSADWVEKAGVALSVRIPPSFRHFLMKYGGGTLVGREVNGLLGLDFDEACGPDIVYETRLERKLLSIPSQWVLLLDIEGDEKYYLDTTTTDQYEENPVIRVNIEDRENPVRYADSFAEFLLKRIKFFFPD